MVSSMHTVWKRASRGKREKQYVFGRDTYMNLLAVALGTSRAGTL